MEGGVVLQAAIAAEAANPASDDSNSAPPSPENLSAPRLLLLSCQLYAKFIFPSDQLLKELARLDDFSGSLTKEATRLRLKLAELIQGLPTSARSAQPHTDAESDGRDVDSTLR